MRIGMSRVAVACLAVAPWLVASPSPAQRRELRCTDIRPFGVLGDVELDWNAPASDMSGLSADEPGIRIDEFSVDYTGERFHVGDRTTVTLVGSVSFGENLAPFSDTAESGELGIEIGARREPLHSEHFFATGTEVSSLDFRLVIPIEATRTGRSRFSARVRVVGDRAVFGRNQLGVALWRPVLDDLPNPILDVGPPYEAHLLGPYPEEVDHGERTVAGIRLDVHTMADGEVWLAEVDDTPGPDVAVPGGAGPDDERSEYVHSKSKAHDGCPYMPPHYRRERIEFRDNELRVRVELDGADCYQEWTFPDLVAFDHPLDPPECEEGEKYDPDACDCVPGDLTVLLLEVTGDGDSSFTPGGVDGIGSGSGAVCGDDRAEPGERCDNADLQGMACDDFGFDGGELRCDPTCGGFDTSECTSDEPPPAPFCGDGTIDPGEACDGANLGGQTCQTLGFDGGALSCNATCDFDTSGCTDQPPPPVCGNGIVEQGEECDGSDFGGKSCSDFDFDQGTLSCTAQCTIDPSDCSNAPPQPTGCAALSGTFEGDGGCGINGPLTVSSTNGTLVLDPFGANGSTRFQISGDRATSESDELVIFGVGGHSCTLSCQSSSQFTLRCKNPDGTCDEDFKP